MTSHGQIPFAIQLRRLFRRDLVFEYKVEFGVARADEQACVIIESDRHDNPRIIERCSKGGIDLADNLVDQLGLLCFHLMASQMRQRAGESGWWVIDNIAPKVRNRFELMDADAVLRALSTQVQAGVSVMNMCMIDGDDPL